MFSVGDSHFLWIGVLMVVGKAFLKRVGVLFLVGDSCFLGVEMLMVVGREIFLRVGISVGSVGNYFLK